MNIIDLYSKLPNFKGKKRIAHKLFGKKLIKQQDRIVTCKDGTKLHIMNTLDYIGYDLFLDQEYEPETIQMIESLLHPGDLFVDAGANIGAVCIPVARQNEVDIIAFEPGKEIYKTLMKNIELNGVKTIIAEQKALKDTSGIYEFYESDRVHGGSTFSESGNFNRIEVEALTLDAYFAEREKRAIAVLKADVQGWEYFLFKGALELIKAGKIRNILFEFEDWAEEKAGLQPGAAQEFLLDNGYILKTLRGEVLHESLRKGSHMLWAHIIP